MANGANKIFKSYIIKFVFFFKRDTNPRPLLTILWVRDNCMYYLHYKHALAVIKIFFGDVLKGWIIICGQLHDKDEATFAHITLPIARAKDGHSFIRSVGLFACDRNRFCPLHRRWRRSRCHNHHYHQQQLLLPQRWKWTHVILKRTILTIFPFFSLTTNSANSL